MINGKEVAYISGGITGVPDYRKRFDEAEMTLMKKGYIVINPARIEDCLPPVFSWEQYMTLCYPMIDMCDSMFFLDNWKTSKGACCEHEYGEEQNKDLYELNKILPYLNNIYE